MQTLVLLLSAAEVLSHGRLMEPPMRASVWRFKEFQKYNPPENYDDDAFWCGGFVTQHNQNGGKCGVCGDNFADNPPRSHEDGGKYGRGIIVRSYKQAQTIPLSVQLTGAHDGYFEFRLCPRSSRSDPESESCFTHLLRLSTGTTRLPATRTTGFYNTSAELPANVKCPHCVLQWHYRAANNWGSCANGTHAIGCGNQETFRGCSDIEIN